MKHLFALLSLFLLLIPAASRAETVANGTLVKIISSDSVYYVVDAKRYTFPNEKVFFSWYADFKSVVTISASELASYPLIGNVTVRPGRWLIKIQTDPKVYAISRYGVLHWVTSEEIASALYGSNWATKVQDIPDTFFLNYQISTPIINAQQYSEQTELAITQIAQNILGATVPVITNPQEALERKTAELINQHRQSKGLSALVWSDEIARVARSHSADMATETVAFGHGGFSDRINRLSAIMDISASAENVSYNKSFLDPAATAVEGWLESQGHLANIEHASYAQTGVGIARSSDGSYYFTQIFITSASGL